MLVTSLSYKELLVYEKKRKDKVGPWTGRDTNKEIWNASKASFEITTNLFVGKNVEVVKSPIIPKTQTNWRRRIYSFNLYSGTPHMRQSFPPHLVITCILDTSD
jgi:hypothetical protein